MTQFYPPEIIDQVNLRLDVRQLMQVIDYRFEKYQESQKVGKGFCPIHREGLFRNLVIDLDTRTFRCQYTQCAGSQGGSLVSLFCQAMGVDSDAGLRQIVRDQQLDISLVADPAVVAEELATVEKQIANDQLDSAEIRLGQVLEAAPENADAQWALLRLYELRNETEQRLELLPTVCRLKIAQGTAADIPELIQEWSESDSDSADARFAFAELSAARGDAEAAVMEYMGGGDASECQGDLEAALHAYKRAAAISAEHNIDVIDVTPHIVRVLTESGRAAEAVDYLYMQSDKAAAESDFTAATEFNILAIEADPARVESHRRFLATAPAVGPRLAVAQQVLDSVVVLRQNDEFDLAISALENWLIAAPEDEQAMQALINEYNNHGRAAEALNLEARRAMLLFETGRAEESREIIENVLTWQPQHIAMLQVLVHAQEQEGLGPEARESRRRLVRAMVAQNQFAQALDELHNPAFNMEDPDVMDLRASSLEGLARSGDIDAMHQAITALEDLAEQRLEESSSRRAIDYLERAIQLVENPSNDLLFKLARAHLRNHNYPAVRDTVISICENLAAEDKLDEAILEAERYSNLIPQDTDLVRYLVELYLRFDDKPAAVARLRRLAGEMSRLGRQDEAEELLEQASELEPKNIENLARQLEHYQEVGNKEKIEQTLNRLAAQHEQEGNLSEAAQLLETFLKSSPADTATIQRLVQVYDKLSDDQAARQWRLNLARQFRAAEDADREARVLRDILARFPEDEEVLNLLMQAEFTRGDMQAGANNARRLSGLQLKAKKPEAARKTLMRAVERVPGNLDINRDIYQFHLNGRQPHQAISWGRKVIDILKTMAKNAEAAEVFETVVGLDPDNLPLKQEQLQFLESTGRMEDAAEKRLDLAAVYRSQERYADAEAMLEAIIQSDARNLRARQQLADLYNHLGETAKAEVQLMRIAGTHHLEGNSQQAIAMLGAVLNSNPAQLDARRQLAQIYRAEGDPSKAIETLLDLADNLRRQHMETEALAAEREALELNPNDEEIHRRLAENLRSTGQLDQAADHLEQVARALLEQKKTDQALAVCDEVVQMLPNRLSARKLRAEIYNEKGDSEAALHELQTIAELAVAVTANSGSVSGTPSAPSATMPFGAVAVPSLQIVPEYTFENFVVGANNDFAHATSLAIARAPAKAYNPFFLYADVGLGKTHLCNAIANYLLQANPRSQIIYTNSEDFTDELITAIQNNAVQQFRTRYRNLDLLIVDDVQFLAGKERAQEEFFHIFNSLFQARRQIVITSDRPPTEISHLESRLRSRFGAGVIVDIASPDLETRLAILNREVAENDLQLEPWILRVLAERVHANVRDLKGALNQVVALRDLRKQELTQENVTRLLDTLYPPTAV